MAAKWKYWASRASDLDTLNKHMAQMAEDGWELVNGSVTEYEAQSTPFNIVHTTYVTYWRKPAS